MTAKPDWAQSPFYADCGKCASKNAADLREAGFFAESLSFRMHICPECGDKRCAKAADHEAACDKAMADKVIRSCRNSR